MKKFFDSKYGKQAAIRSERSYTRILLTTIHLCIINSPKREDLYKFAEKQKKYYYRQRPNDFKIEYTNSLPKEMFNKDLFNQEEFRLLQILTNLHVNPENTFDIYNFLIEELKKTDFGSFFIPILEDFDNFRIMNSNVITRAYSVPLDRLEHVMGIKNYKTDYLMGKENLDLINEFYEDKGKFFKFY